jgi:hypothetical protein
MAEDRAGWEKSGTPICAYPQWYIGENGQPIMQNKPYRVPIKDALLEAPHEGNEDHPLFNPGLCQVLWDKRTEICEIELHPSLGGMLFISLPQYFCICKRGEGLLTRLVPIDYALNLSYFDYRETIFVRFNLDERGICIRSQPPLVMDFIEGNK